MPLFFCSWSERASLLLEAESEDAARELATKVEGEGETRPGEPPSMVRIFVGFVAEVYEEDGLVTVEPLPICEDLLLVAEVDSLEQCEAEADDEHGRVVRCALPRHADPEHVGPGGLVWKGEA
jgi:hypothetical protein